LVNYVVIKKLVKFLGSKRCPGRYSKMMVMEKGIGNLKLRRAAA
jgi:hypothetical protein